MESSLEVLAASDESDAAAISGLLQTSGFAEAKSGSFASSHVIKDATNGDPISALYAPIKTDEHVDGVLIAVLDLKSFGNDFVVPLKSGQTGQAQVFRNDGALVLTSTDTTAFSSNIADLHIAESTLGQKRGTLSYEISGSTYVAAYRHIDELGWTALVSAQEDEVLSSARDARLIPCSPQAC